ncbi:MAG TPA: bifunctional UDP-sugar hydrolase/5'-nucleotidase, partial [Minicystis sp.]|nr:bifunctional UDP-sugar hydrolase/5'-nucleotidase [Minicystis sp.]
MHGQVHLTIIHTADMHSRLFPYNLQLGQVDAGLGLGAANAIVNVGGAARLSHIVGRERARATRVLHIDGGDCFQGAPIFNFYSGEAEMRTEAAIGTDLMVLANHEFDRGAQNVATQIENWATFPVLAANYRFDPIAKNGVASLGTVVQPFTTFDVQGLRVGVIGMGNLSSLTSIFDNPNSFGITPLNTVETAQFYVDLLRPMVDVVIVATHLGIDVDEYMIQNTEGIDVVLGGHNHIVLQPPKRVQDCSANSEPDGKGGVRHFILLDDPDPAHAGEKVKRYCTPRDVVLAHSGAFAKYVGRLDAIFSNDPKDFAPGQYTQTSDKNGLLSKEGLPEGFELLTQEYQLFPVTEEVPEDPVVSSLLEPYAQGLETLANLDLLVGYALDGSKRNSTSGGDSPLGNLISTAMWLRLGIQTDFSLTNTTGIRTDLVPGPVTIEEMYNIFPFDNSVTKMQLSGSEVKELFDFVARRSAERGCVSQAQIAGARVVLDCTKVDPTQPSPGTSDAIYIGAAACTSDASCGTTGHCDTKHGVCTCTADDQCPSKGIGSCDVENAICWQPIDPISEYELATSNYLAAGGSGFFVLQHNTTQLDTKVQQRDALVDYIRAGDPCGADPTTGKLKDCATDADCTGVGDGFVCACPEAAVEGDVCATDPSTKCSKGQCILAQCRDDLAQFQRDTCAAAPSEGVKQSCEQALAPCASAGEQ